MKNNKPKSIRNVALLLVVGFGLAIYSAKAAMIFGLIFIVLPLAAIIRPIDLLGMKRRAVSFSMLLFVGLGSLTFALVAAVSTQIVEPIGTVPAELKVEVAAQKPISKTIAAAAKEDDLAAKIKLTVGEWTTDCTAGCRTYSSVDYTTFPESEPTRLVLEIDQKNTLLLRALVTEKEYGKWYTGAPPVELTEGKTKYLADIHFFLNKNPVTVIFSDGQTIELVELDGAHRRAEITDKDITALAVPGTITLDLTNSVLSGIKTALISTDGFRGAYEARTVKSSRTTTSSGEYLDALANALSGNRYGLVIGDILAEENPKGEGMFFYVSEDRFKNLDDKFIWFANGGTIASLNGRSRKATPTLGFPINAGIKLLDGANMDVMEIPAIGQAVAFGR